MAFWKMGYDLGWIEESLLKQAVITEKNPFGDITEDEYKQITSESYVE